MLNSKLVRTFAVATFAASMLLSVACGSSVSTAPKAADGSGKTESASDPIDPCALLTMDEVTAAAGQPMLAGEFEKGSNPFGQTMCLWGAEAALSHQVVQLSVMRESDFDPLLKKKNYDAKALYEQALTLYPSPVELDGVGRAAFRSDNTLQVLGDGVAFTVSVGLAGRHSVSDDTLVSLARSVEARLN